MVGVVAAAVLLPFQNHAKAKSNQIQCDSHRSPSVLRRVGATALGRQRRRGSPASGGRWGAWPVCGPPWAAAAGGVTEGAGPAPLRSKTKNRVKTEIEAELHLKNESNEEGARKNRKKNK